MTAALLHWSLRRTGLLRRSNPPRGATCVYRPLRSLTTSGVSSLPTHVPLTPTQRALVERTSRGHVGVVGAFATGKSTCAAQRVLWLDASNHDRCVLALSGRGSTTTATPAPLVQLLDRATTFHALERRGHRVAGVMEWTQQTLEELGLRTDAQRVLSFGQLTAFLMHHAASLPLRTFHQRLATSSSLQLRRSVADMVRFFTTLEAHGVQRDVYTAYAATVAGETGDESHLELAHAYGVYYELQQRHDVRSWDGLVLDLQHAFETDRHCLAAATREFTDVVIDDVDGLTPAMVATLALVLQQPHLQSSTSFSHHDSGHDSTDADGGCARMTQLHGLLTAFGPETVHLTSDGDASTRSSSDRASVRRTAAQILPGTSSVSATEKSVPTTCFEFATAEDEAVAIAAWIQQRQLQGVVTTTPLPLRVTVLCPSKTDVDAVTRTFLAQGLRVNGRDAVNTTTRRVLFDEPGVDTLFSLLVALWSPSDTKHLYNVLRSEFVAFPPHVLSMLMEMQHRRKSHATLTDVVAHFVESQGLELRGSAVDDATLVAAVAAATKFLDVVAECRDACHRQSVAEIVQLFLDRTGHLARLLDPQTPRDARQAIALAALLREIDAAQRVVQSVHVPMVVPYLAQLQSARVVSVNDQDDSDRAHDDDSTNDVRVLPLTRFDLDAYEATRDNDENVVVFMAMRDAKFPGRLKRITWPLPTALMATPLPVQTRAEFLADAERLVYDALVQLHATEIVVSYATSTGSGTSSKKPEILSRVLTPLWTTPTETPLPSDGSRPTPSSPPTVSAAREEAASLPDSIQPSPISPSVFEPSHLSYSQIAEYTRCPHQYYLSRVLGLRDLASSSSDGDTTLAMMFGSAVHEAVAAFGEALQQGDTMATAEAAAHSALDRAWRRDGFLSTRQEAFLWARAQSTLRGFLQRHDPVSEIVAVEHTFECRLGRNSDVLLRGVWDRVDRTTATDGSAIVIREFKTNPSAQRRTNMDAAAAESLQLQIYLVAYEQLHGVAPHGATLEVLEEDDAPNAVGFVPFTRDLRARVDDMVDTTMAAIRRGEFDATPSFMACGFCPYASSVCRANVADDTDASASLSS